MGSKTSDQPLDEYLKDGGRDERIEQTDGGIIHIPKASDADLADEEDGDGDQGTQKRSSPDGDDLVPQRIGELRVDDFTILKGDWLFVSAGILDACVYSRM